MTTLQRVQDAANTAARYVGGPAHVVFKAFVDALEIEIVAEELEAAKKEGRKPAPWVLKRGTR